MNEQICEILKKYNVQRFNLFKEDLFTYVLETEELKDETEIDLLEEIYGCISDTFKVKHRVIQEPKSVKEIVDLAMTHDFEPIVPLKPDNVNHPPHYNMGKIEVIEALEDWNLDFHCANAIKYIARAGRKDPSKEIEDLEKATWYLKRKMETLKAKKENRNAVKPNNMPKMKEPFSVTGAYSSGPKGLQMDSVSIVAPGSKP